MSGARIRQSAVVTTLLLLMGCSAIVDPESAPVRCQITDGVDPCPTGKACIGGVCATPPACSPADEICDQHDNDCDGKIDEGFDVDGDGVKQCGDGHANTADCNDSNAMIHPASGTIPAGIEICDDRDDDCDSTIDEAEGSTPLCPSGQTCVRGECIDPSACRSDADCVAAGTDFVCDLSTTPARCVKQTTTVCTAATETHDCGAGHYCDPTAGCRAEKMLGEACGRDGECASGACFEAAALGLSMGTRYCSQPCCGDGDCGAGALCWAPGTGARGCLPKSLVGITNTTLHFCTSPSDCGGSTCAVEDHVMASGVPLARALVCGSVGSHAYGDSCSSSSDCASGVCMSGGLFGVCTGPCGSDADCHPIESIISTTCTEVQLGSFTFGACTLAASGSHTGSHCSAASDCEGFCGSDGVCGDLCCSDGACPPDYKCRPRHYGSGASYPMFCQHVPAG